MVVMHYGCALLPNVKTSSSVDWMILCSYKGVWLRFMAGSVIWTLKYRLRLILDFHILTQCKKWEPNTHIKTDLTDFLYKS